MFGLACDFHLFIVSFGFYLLFNVLSGMIYRVLLFNHYFLVKAYKSCVYAEGIITQFEKVCTIEINVT